MNHKTLLMCLVLACAPFLSVSAQTTSQRIDNLEKMIEGLQDELAKARVEINRVKNSSVGKGVVKTDGENITVSTTGGGIEIESDNGNSFKLGGRIMLDYDAFDGVFSEDGKSESESEFRRTRLSASGAVKKDWKYKFTVNINDEEETADIHTAYIQYAGFEPLTLTVGKFKEPFSLERLTSSKWISTIERNMTLDLLGGNLGAGEPDHGGVQVSGYHKKINHFNWAIGVFDDGSEDADGDDNYAVTGRVAMSPHFGDDHFLHLGAAYSKRDIEGSVQYQSRFGVHTADEVSTVQRYVDDADQFGLEAAYVRGAFSLQGEYIEVSADGDTAMDEDVPDACLERGEPVSCGDLDFDGYYIQGTYTLTGESRSYKTRGAYFDKIEPKSALGAWELVARYEEVEVEDDGAGDGEASDGEAEKWVLGVNWYANNNIKFMLNYIDVETDNDGLIIDGRPDDDGNAWSLRAQYVF